jgi:L-ascorbate metabolism protein UlaG (beta-lactamase superfamily)
MLLTFEGHACFSLTANNVNIIIDPFITENPACKKSLTDFKPDLILITHGHNDHLGNALELARSCGATIAAQVDLLNALDTEGLDKMAFNLGGCADFNGVHLIMVPAWHGSSVKTKQGWAYGGVACGYIIEDKSGSVYHAGDTALFGDMGLVLARYNIDCALLPIGDFYTMGPKDAVTAAHWLKARTIIPMHYNTFPVIEQDAAAFKHDVEDRTESKCVILQPGESWEFKR